MTKLLVRLAPVFALLVAASPARAGILELYGQVQGGGMYGQGIAGAQKDQDFFNAAKGADYGVKVGAEVLFVDVWVEHNQFTRFSRIDGTWTQFMLGFDWDFPLGDAPEPGKQPKTFGQVGIGAGYGVGTGQQVEPPLDNAQVSDKGFIGQLELSAEYRFNDIMAIGLAVPIQYGYLFKNLVDANNEENQYQSIHAAGLLYLRLHLGFE